MFSDILTLTPEERQSFAALRNGVLADLQPEGELLHGLADQIVVLRWRLRQCVRLEQHAVAEQQALQGGAEGLIPPAGRPGYRELEERHRLLQEVRDAAERGVEPPPGLREHSCQVLGAAFTRALFDWQPPNLTAMWMCEEMVAKSRTWFHKETPSELIEDTNMVRGRTPAEIDADAERQMQELRASHSSLCYEMSHKLVALKQEQLAQLAEQTEAEARWAELTGKKDRLDSYGQHHARLARQLERAELHYFKLRALLQSRS